MLSAIKFRPAEKAGPSVYDLPASGFYSIHYAAERGIGYPGIVIAEDAPPGAGQPYFGRAAVGGAFAYMNMDRFSRPVFV